MITTGTCVHCGSPLNPAMRADAIFCSPNCRLQHFRARAGDVLPFDPLIEVASRFGHIQPTTPDTMERALARVAQTERAYEAARAAAVQLAEKLGQTTNGIFKNTKFVWRSTAEDWRKEAAEKARAEAEAAASIPAKSATSSWPVSPPAPEARKPRMTEEERAAYYNPTKAVEPADEAAEYARINALPSDQKAAAIVAAAAKARPKKKEP